MKPLFPFVPFIKTNEKTPLIDFEGTFYEKKETIEKWFRSNWVKTPAPFYASVDIRNAGFKLAPVDTNLFPAGFNNLSFDSEMVAIHSIQVAIERYCPEASNIILIAENHTRNLMYLESVCRLRDMISKAGFAIRVANLSTQEIVNFTLPSGKTLQIHPLERKGDKLCINDFIPCSIILNNDLSGGNNKILEGISQHLFPPPCLGWQYRTKGEHFSVYTTVVEEFCKIIDLDPWLIAPQQLVTTGIDFKTGIGVEELAEKIDIMLDNTQKKYDEFSIKAKPYAIVKANSGTYGMGVMAIKSSDEIRRLNRKQRNNLKVGKEGLPISELLVQEGIPSYEVVGTELSVAEPVVYMIDHYVVGGFYRIHKNKGVDESLNAPGMIFEPLDFSDCLNKIQAVHTDETINPFYPYGVISRLALLAAAQEVASVKNIDC